MNALTGSQAKDLKLGSSDSLKIDKKNFKHFFQDAFSFVAQTFTKIGTVSKISNIAAKVIKLVQVIWGEDFFPTLDLIKLPIKSIKNVTGIMKLADKGSEFVCPEDSAHPAKQRPFWLNPGTSNIKVAHKVVTAVASILKAVKFLGSLSLLNLAKAAEAIGKIPVLGVLSQIPFSIMINVVQCIGRLMGAIVDIKSLIDLEGKLKKNGVSTDKWTQRIQNLQTILNDIKKSQSEKIELKPNGLIHINFDSNGEIKEQKQKSSEPKLESIEHTESKSAINTASPFGDNRLLVAATNNYCLDDESNVTKYIQQLYKDRFFNTSKFNERHLKLSAPGDVGESEKPSLDNKLTLMSNHKGNKKMPPSQQEIAEIAREIYGDVLWSATECQNTNIKQKYMELTLRYSFGPKTQSNKDNLKIPLETLSKESPLSQANSTISIFNKEELVPANATLELKPIVQLPSKINYSKESLEQRQKLVNHFVDKIETTSKKILALEQKASSEAPIDSYRFKLIKWENIVNALKGDDEALLNDIKSQFVSKNESKCKTQEILKQTKIQRTLALVYKIIQVTLAVATISLFLLGIGGVVAVSVMATLYILTYSFGIFKFFWQESHLLPKSVMIAQK